VGKIKQNASVLIMRWVGCVYHVVKRGSFNMAACNEFLLLQYAIVSSYVLRKDQTTERLYGYKQLQGCFRRLVLFM